MKPWLQLLFLNIFCIFKSKIILLLFGLQNIIFQRRTKQKFAMQRNWNEAKQIAKNKERVEIFKFWPETKK